MSDYVQHLLFTTRSAGYMFHSIYLAMCHPKLFFLCYNWTECSIHIAIGYRDDATIMGRLCRRTICVWWGEEEGGVGEEGRKSGGGLLGGGYRVMVSMGGRLERDEVGGGGCREGHGLGRGLQGGGPTWTTKILAM